MAGVTRAAVAAEDRLPDRVGIGVLTRAFPSEVVDAAVEAAGVRERRYRALPARLMVYFVLAMCLFARSGYAAVLGKLTSGLRWSGVSTQDWVVPSTGSITKARKRLGSEVMRRLFRQVAGPEGGTDTLWRGLRVCGLDGTTVELPDSAANEDRFGRPSSGKDLPGPFPLARVVALAECGTKALLDAAIGAFAGDDERALTRRLLSSFTPGMLILADRGFPGHQLWRDATATGADLLWRTSCSFSLPRVTVLADGTYLSRLRPQRATHGPPLTVRVIEYTVTTTRPDTHGQTSTDSELFCLITTLTDPAQAPAAELAELYARRWSIETAFGALKTEQRGPNIVLRSHEPQGVEQEIWAMLCVYQALRQLICQAADHGNIDPATISFTSALETTRDSVTGGFSP